MFDEVIYVQVDDMQEDGSFARFYTLIESTDDVPLEFRRHDSRTAPSVIVNRRKDELFAKIESTSASYPTYNTKEIADLGNKKISFGVFSKYMPRTCVSDDKHSLDRLLNNVETVVVKPLRENGGKDIVRLPSKDVHEYISIHSKEIFIVQEFIETSAGVKGITDGRHDIRIYVIDGEVLLLAVRVPASGGYLANTAKGGQIKFLDITSIEPELAKMLNEIVKTIQKIAPHYFVSIDFFKSSTGWYLIEINDQPGLPANFQTHLSDRLINKLVQSIYNYSTQRKL